MTIEFLDEQTGEFFGTVGVSENIIDASWKALTDALELKLLAQEDSSQRRACTAETARRTAGQPGQRPTVGTAVSSRRLAVRAPGSPQSDRLRAPCFECAGTIVPVASPPFRDGVYGGL